MSNDRSAVSVVRCGDYDPGRVQAAVEQAVDLVGGISGVVKQGSRVLIKPNLLKGSRPEAAVTTHPEIIRSVIRLVHRSGGRAFVGDSPGLGELKRVCEKAGVLRVIEQEGALLADMEEPASVRNAGQFQQFEVCRAALEADLVINLPKLKTHGMMTITGAVKNTFGCIPGRRKAQWHLKTGVNREAFARMLVELSALVKPRLTVMDAVIGMEGNGPGSGNPRPIGLVLAGHDPVSVDLIAASILGVPRELHYIIKAAKDAGIGETELERIQVRGEQIDTVLVSGFRLPHQEHTEWPLPEWARRSLKQALTTRPVIDHSRCISCGICRQHCPQQAIEATGQELTIRYRDCIRCFCCQEFCPQGAITVGRGWALRFLQ